MGKTKRTLPDLTDSEAEGKVEEEKEKGEKEKEEVEEEEKMRGDSSEDEGVLDRDREV